jgi:hypothetical protein
MFRSMLWIARQRSERAVHHVCGVLALMAMAGGSKLLTIVPLAGK